MMTINEFHEAQAHNTRIINNILDTKTTAGLEDIIFWENPTHVSFDLILSKGFDILGCCAIGAIPSIQHSGADGFAYFQGNDEIFEIETKVSSVNTDYVYKGPKGGIKVRTPGTNTTPTGITSHLSGRFNPYISDQTRQTKERYTALVCFDRKQNKIIDAWLMDPKTVLKELNSLPSLSLSLARFLQSGHVIPTPVHKIGWGAWKDSIQSA